MNGYLIDTNTLTYLFLEKAPEHTSVCRRLAAVPDGVPVVISVISLGEIEFGHRWESDSATPPQKEFNTFLHKAFPLVLPVRESTRLWYGQLRAKLFRAFRPRATKRPKWPEDLVEQATAKVLGIQENDLWLVAQALDRNLVFVTNDRMTRIRHVAPSELRLENWALA